MAMEARHHAATAAATILNSSWKEGKWYCITSHEHGVHSLSSLFPKLNGNEVLQLWRDAKNGKRTHILLRAMSVGGLRSGRWWSSAMYNITRGNHS